MKSFRLVLVMLVALSAVALLTGCGKDSTPTGVTALDESAPAAPTELARQADDTTPNGALVWAPSVSANVAGYLVYQSPLQQNDLAYTLVGETDASTPKHALPFSSEPLTVYFRVKAVSSTNVSSVWSETFAVNIGPPAAGGDEPVPAKDEPVTKPLPQQP